MSPNRARHRARDLLVKALYQRQAADHGFDELVEQFAETREYAGADQQYFRELLRIVLEETPELDVAISRYAVRGIDQLDEVGRGILRLAFAELRHRPDVPAKVVINEAVELAKRYGATDTFRFVNAVLDKAAKEGRSGAAPRRAPGSD
ncbi:MAG TPA: transcription antitermination factor NusB [Gammaproteobacteria bacterium]|nr:transcription antitermination factor NusB [Gammaproteobacteria bacterium]